MTQFLKFMCPLKVQEGEDALLWKDNRRENFSVKLYYKSLSAESNLVFPTKKIWELYGKPQISSKDWDFKGGQQGFKGRQQGFKGRKQRTQANFTNSQINENPLQERVNSGGIEHAELNN